MASGSTSVRIVVIGLGYVGLPLAVALARKFDVVGFDVDCGRIGELRGGPRPDRRDRRRLRSRQSKLELTDRAEDCARRGHLHRHRADAGRCEQPPGPLGGARRDAHDRRGRSTPSAGRRSSTKAPSIPASPRRFAGREIERGRQAPARPRLPPRLLARADQPGRPRAQHRQDRQGHRRRGRRGASSSSPRSTARSPAAACSARRRSRRPRRPRRSRTPSATSTSPS